MHWLTYFFVIMFLFFIILVLALSFPIALLVTPPKAGYSKKTVLENISHHIPGHFHIRISFTTLNLPQVLPFYLITSGLKGSFQS